MALREVSRVSGLDESAFEEYVSTWLVDHGGYDAVKGPQSPSDFDAASALDTAELFAFIGTTQGADRRSVRAWPA